MPLPRSRLCRMPATNWFLTSVADPFGTRQGLSSWRPCGIGMPGSSWQFSLLGERVFRFQHSPFTPQIVPNAAESVYFAGPCALIK